MINYFVSQNIVDTLRALKEYQDLLESLRQKGVEVDKIIELLRALFGLPQRGEFVVFNNCKCHKY
jgi:hypothetical protein